MVDGADGLDPTIGVVQTDRGIPSGCSISKNRRFPRAWVIVRKIVADRDLLVVLHRLGAKVDAIGLESLASRASDSPVLAIDNALSGLGGLATCLPGSATRFASKRDRDDWLLSCGPRWLEHRRLGVGRSP